MATMKPDHQHDYDEQLDEMIAREVATKVQRGLRNFFTENDYCLTCATPAVIAGLLAVIAHFMVSTGVLRSSSEARKFAGDVEKRLYRQINHQFNNAASAPGKLN